MDAYRRLLAEDTARSRQRGRELARVDLALARWTAGEVDAALDDLHALPASVESLLAIARVEEARGQPVEAVLALQQAVALAPDRVDLRLRLEELMAASGGPE